MRIELSLTGTTNCAGPDLQHPLGERTSQDPAKEPITFVDGPNGTRTLDCRWAVLRDGGTVACTIYKADLPFAVRRSIESVREAFKGQQAFNVLTKILDGSQGIARRAELDYHCRLANRDI